MGRRTIEICDRCDGEFERSQDRGSSREVQEITCEYSVTTSQLRRTKRADLCLSCRGLFGHILNGFLENELEVGRKEEVGREEVEKEREEVIGNPRKDELWRRFTYHKPSGIQSKGLFEFRRRFETLARRIDIEVPDCRERSLAITKLEESMMWAIAGMVRPDREALE